MKLPIIVVSCDSKEVDIFDAPDDTARSMEAVDVESGVYKAFSGDGRPLKLLASKRAARGLFGLLGGGAAVLIQEGGEGRADTEWLAEELRRHLAVSGKATPDASVSELIQLFCENRRSGPKK